MNDISHETGEREVARLDGAGRVVYVVLPENLPPQTGGELTLRDAWSMLWRDKWIIVAVTALFAVLSLVYALRATHWFRAEVLLAPAEQRSAPALGGTLGGLANLAGISVGGGDGAEAVAVLNSRDFARQFIENGHLIPVLFPKAEAAQPKGDQDSRETNPPDLRDAVRYFDLNVLSVSTDRSTGFVTLAVEWTDPKTAAKWANALVEQVNERMRQKALAEAEADVSFLRHEFEATSVVTLQQSIGHLLETELQKLMLARENKEFAFRVIDPATPPKQRVRPARTLIVMLGTVMGGMLAVCIVVLRGAFRAAKTGS